jgi:hypothetical protein
MKIYNENISDIFDNYYEDDSYKSKKYYYNKYRNNNDNSDEFIDYEDDFEKPKSTFEFLITYIKNRFLSFFYNFEEYFTGLKFVLSKYKFLFRRFLNKEIINKTLSNKYSEAKKIKTDDLMNYKASRKLEQIYPEKIIIKNIIEALNTPSFPYNNSDLYNKTNCPTLPDLKVNYYHYFCDKKRVSKEEYLNRTSKGELCEFYNNTQKICFCPIHYSNCQFGSSSKLKCMIKQLIVNNEYDLIKYYDTFNDEHTKIPILNNDKKIFNFSLKLKCGFELPDSISGSDLNFYLINGNDILSDFDIISTEYHNQTDNGTQYTKEEVMNNTNKILNYFIKKKNLIIYKNTSLYLKFSLVDQMWAIPFRIKFYEIKEDTVEDILSGEKYFNFTVDINDLIENEEGEGPFMNAYKDFKFPFFDKGDLHFFEIEIIDEYYKQIRFVPFRGEIKK